MLCHGIRKIFMTLKKKSLRMCNYYVFFIAVISDICVRCQSSLSDYY